jgi:hypothetical protein
VPRPECGSGTRGHIPPDGHPVSVVMPIFDENEGLYYRVEV